MVMSGELLKILVCPETKERLELASDAICAKVNAEIAAGHVLKRTGGPVQELCDAVLLRADGKVAYAVRGGIPVLLVEEGMAVAL